MRYLKKKTVARNLIGHSAVRWANTGATDSERAFLMNVELELGFYYDAIIKQLGMIKEKQTQTMQLINEFERNPGKFVARYYGTRAKGHPCFPLVPREAEILWKMLESFEKSDTVVKLR